MGIAKRAALFASTILASATTAVSAMAQEAPESGPGPQEGAGQVEEIVVTARRREETLQNVPASVTALTGETLERRNLTGLREIGSFVPNLSLSEAGTNANGAAVYIRGVGQSAPRVTLDPGVGIYVDGIYRQSLNGGFMSLLDIARVEVLRGPQGTLYGRNTIGGAIKIETRKPDLNEVEGRGSVTYGSFDRIDADGAISLPLVEDKLALKFGVSKRQADGFIDRPDGSASGDDDETALQGQVRWLPMAAVDVLLSVDHSTSSDLGLTKFATAVNPAATNVVFYNNNVASGRIPGPRYSAESVITTDPRRTNETSPFARVDFEETGASLSATFDIGTAEIRSYTSYRQNEQTDGFDTDGSALEIAATDRRFSNEQFSQELQLNTELFDGFIQFVGGVYYLTSEDSQLAFQLVAPAVAAAGGADRSTGTGADQSLVSYSAYGEAKFNLTDRFSASVGMRYVLDEKEVTGTAIRFARTAPVILRQSAADEWSSVSPRLLLEYQATRDQLFYGSVTKGFKSGGINDTVNQGANPPPLASFDPETLIAYEVGSKSQLLDRRVTLNAAAFYSNYKDLQVRLLEQTDLGLVRQFVNAGGARSFGVELELQASLTANLKLNASAAYLNSEFTEEVRDAGGELLFSTGDVLDRSPEFSYTLGVEYVTEPVGPGLFRARADYGWRDEQKFELAGGASRLGSDAYGLLNASLAYEIDDVTLSVFGKNLADEEYVTGSLDSFATNGATFLFLGRPREVGVKLSARF